MVYISVTKELSLIPTISGEFVAMRLSSISSIEVRSSWQHI